MASRLLLFTVLFLVLPVALSGNNVATSVHSELPMSAGRFVDTIGINVHLHNANTLYGDFPLISSAIFDLGIRHIRDGMIPTTWDEYYRRHTALAEHGIRCIYITGANDTEEQILQFSKRVSPAVEGFEAPNEYDNTGGPQWAEQLLNWLPRLHALSSSNAFPYKVPVIGPSLVKTNSDTKIQSLKNKFDLANMHNYFGGWNPGTTGWGDGGYGSIQWNIAASEKAWGVKKLVTTETGYTTDLSQPQSIPEKIQALYAPRIFLEQALHRISRTYLYELADGNNDVPVLERSYGILRADGSRKPAFTSIQRLINLLLDSDSEITVHPVKLDLISSHPELHHLLFQKIDGSLYLAFWVELPAFDQNTRQAIAVSAIPFSLRTNTSTTPVFLYSLDPEKPATATRIMPDANKEIHLTASGVVSILQFSSTN